MMLNHKTFLRNTKDNHQRTYSYLRSNYLKSIFKTHKCLCLFTFTLSSYAFSSPFMQDYSSNLSNLQQFSTHAIRRFSSIYKLGKTKITIYIGLITTLGRNNTKASCSLNILNIIHNTNHIVFVSSLNTSNRTKVKKIPGRLLSKQQGCNLIKTIHKAFELHI